MLEILPFALLLGLTHALEADHVTTVSNLSLNEKGNINATRHGISWSLGHAFTLLLVLFPLFIFEKGISEHVLIYFEYLACCILIYLGCKTILNTSKRYFKNIRHSASALWHQAFVILIFLRPARNGKYQLGSWYIKQVSYPALAIGLVHGFAGSSVIALKLQNLISDIGSLLYIVAVLSIGITVAMILFLKLFLVPLVWNATKRPSLLVVLHVCVGLASITAGLALVLI